MAQSSKFHENCGCFLICTPHKTRTFTVQLAVTTKYQGNGFAALVLLGRGPSKSRPNRSHRKRSYSISNIGNMMGCDRQPPKLRPSRSICRRVMAFRILFNNDRPLFWILKILIFNLMTVIAVLTCGCIPNFIKIGSRVRPPDAHNCRMFNAPLLAIGRFHDNRIMTDMSGTWWDVTTQVAF